jgi:hypothetical protein
MYRNVGVFAAEPYLVTMCSICVLQLELQYAEMDKLEMGIADTH